ncbi:hypothetical protein F2Q70_00029353 [Brassica cretica]|uniref:histidine kinase n=1 Tax=Brassica cretica TaxID=69181 RepID=A0A8S9FD86_BRACR|nr:hypothetical protein F2Q70_00029353 [Brassica cretica]
MVLGGNNNHAQETTNGLPEASSDAAKEELAPQENSSLTQEPTGATEVCLVLLTRYIRNPPTRINQPHLHPDKLNGVLWIGVDPEVHEFIKATWQGNFWGPWQSWLKQQYYWEDGFHEEIFFKWKLQTQVIICGRISQKRQKNKQPSYVSATVWETILANWSTAEAKAKSQSVNLVVVEEGLERPVSYPDLVRKTHCRKDGTFLDERAEALVLEVEQARGQTRMGTIYGLGNLQFKNKRPSESVPAALHTARSIQSKWLRKHGIATVEASDWNELTQIIRDLFETGSRENSFDSQHTIAESLRAELSNIQEIRNPVFVIVVDIGVLDLTTDIWKEQLNYLDRFSSKAKFAWLLKHDTSNTVKTELRRKGHVMMVNKPLYKAKMIQILEAVIKNRRRGLRGNGSDDSHDCLEIDPTQFDTCSSDDSSDTSVKPTVLPSPVLKNYLLDITKSNDESTSMTQKKQEEEEDWKDRSNRLYSGVALDGKNQKSLEGVRILLAEDTPVLQRVATIMLEKMGATVTAVWDGQQAVDALNYKSINAQEHNNLSEEEETNPQSDLPNSSPYDLILMDCQMPKMDGYEATKAIRRAEIGTSLHVPIVALTAHAMSSDEAKCLEVGMDAYLTKPIDRKLMVSTILSLTKPSTVLTSFSD